MQGELGKRGGARAVSAPGRGRWAEALPWALCPQVANHVVQALLNQKVSGHGEMGRSSHP